MPASCSIPFKRHVNHGHLELDTQPRHHLGPVFPPPYLILTAVRVFKLSVLDAWDPSKMEVAAGKSEILKARPDLFFF